MSEQNDKFQDLKTDEKELSKLLEKYDIDEQLEQIFNSIDARFNKLEIKYQSLINARRFLQDK